MATVYQVGPSSHLALPWYNLAMKIPASKAGLALSGLYVLFVLWTVIESQSCDGMMCGLVIVLPALPWVMLADGVLPPPQSEFASYAWLALFFVLNAFVLYWIGKVLEIIATWVFRKFRTNGQVPPPSTP